MSAFINQACEFHIIHSQHSLLIMELNLDINFLCFKTYVLEIAYVSEKQ
jgi:hypothetical protein